MGPMAPANNPIVSLRRQHRWRMALSGFVILAAGIGLGVAGTLMFAPPVRPIEPSPNVDMAVAGMVRWVREELGLSEEQVGKIEKTFRQCLKKLEELRQEARPKIEEQIQAMKQDIDKVLTEEQRQGWQRIAEHFDRDLQRGFRDRGPGRGGMRGGRGDWPGGPGPEGDRGRRGGMGPGDPNGPPPWGGMGPGDPNGSRGDRPPWFDRPRGPNDPGRSQWRDRRDPNDFRPPDRLPRNRDPNVG